MAFSSIFVDDDGQAVVLIPEHVTTTKMGGSVVSSKVLEKMRDV